MLRCLLLLCVLSLATLGQRASADEFDDCIIENMKGITNDQAALDIRNACTSKFRKIVALTDISFLEGQVSYRPPIFGRDDQKQLRRHGAQHHNFPEEQSDRKCHLYYNLQLGAPSVSARRWQASRRRHVLKPPDLEVLCGRSLYEGRASIRRLRSPCRLRRSERRPRRTDLPRSTHG